MFCIENIEEFKIGAVNSAAEQKSASARPLEANHADALAPARQHKLIAGAGADNSLDCRLSRVNLNCHRDSPSRDVLDVNEDEATVARQ